MDDTCACARGLSSTGFRSALDNLFCAALILNNDGELLYANTSANALIKNVGVDFESLLRSIRAHIDLVRGKGRATFEHNGRQLICNVYPWVIDGARQGSTLILHESLHPNCSAMEADLYSRMLQEINALIESSHDGIMVTDPDGTVSRINASAERMLGVSRQAALGRKLHELIDEGIINRSAALEAIETRRPSTVMVDAKDRTLIVTATPIFDANDQVSSVIDNIRDMSELNELRRRLEEQTLLTEGYLRELNSLHDKHHAELGFIASSPRMEKILETITDIARVDSTVLVTGESGTGKEVLVQQIQRTSIRRDKPFIKINCGAIPAPLFESELFGYEDGAFTGARHKGKAGFFELANGGTLFLDEIGELASEVQVKLLRAIQEGEITRIGAARSIQVDVRIIAATNQDLWSLVQEGRFRQDLYYRLNVISIEVPPLRARREDIIPLAQHFLGIYNRKAGVKKELSVELCRLLCRMDWPGNIRELENLIENMVVLCRDETITSEHLPAKYHAQGGSPHKVTVRGIMPMRELLEEAENQLLRNAQEQYATTTEIARALGVNQSTISRKLSRLK